MVPLNEGRRHHSQLLRITPKPGVVSLVFLQETLAQVEDGWGPKPYEDRRLAPARKVERKRDQDRDEGPSNVDSFVAVHMLHLPVRLFGILYLEVIFVNPEGNHFCTLLEPLTSENSVKAKFALWAFSEVCNVQVIELVRNAEVNATSTHSGE